MRAKRFRSFHTSDQEHDPEAIQPKDHQNNFKDILESCDFIDPDMDSFVCRKAKMLGHMLDNHPGPDNHKKWKVCNDLLHKLDLQDMTTRKQLNAYCLSYMQKLYNKSKRTEYLHTRGVGGKSKIFRLHFGNNWFIFNEEKLICTLPWFQTAIYFMH